MAMRRVPRQALTPSSSSGVSSMYFFRSSRVSMRFLTCQCQSFHSSSVTLGNRILRRDSTINKVILSKSDWGDMETAGRAAETAAGGKGWGGESPPVRLRQSRTGAEMSQMIGTVVQLQVLLLEVLLELGILTQRPTQCSIVRGPRDLTSSGRVNCPCGNAARSARQKARPASAGVRAETACGIPYRYFFSKYSLSWAFSRSSERVISA